MLTYQRDADGAADLAKRIDGMGRRCLAVQADVTDETSILALRDQAFAEAGVPDILVANAVVQYAWKPILEQPIADFESQFRSCVLQSVFLSQAFLPALIDEIAAGKRKDGRFIAINTECAMQCTPGQGAYASGKRGLDGLMRVLAREVGPSGITVNQVAPGWVISRRDRQKGSESQPGYESVVPLRRRGTDRDIALAVAYLASDLGGFVTGCYFPVCGGNVMPTI